MTSFTCVIQACAAPTGSLGQPLATVEGMPLLGILLNRLEGLECERLIVATSDRNRDDAVVGYCRDRAVKTVRGPRHDGLALFIDALKVSPADHAVRLRADHFLVDRELVGDLVEAQVRSGADYTSNTLVRTFPEGLDVEIMKVTALRRACLVARDGAERQQVTPFLYRHPELFRLGALRTDDMAGDERWTVDTPEELEDLRQLVRLAGGWRAGWRSLLEVAGRRYHCSVRGLRLRPAAPWDEDMLLRWRNEPVAVKFSRSGQTVGAEDHRRWFRRVLSDPSTRIWIGESDGAPVGYVRIDVEAAIAEVSVAVDSERRGHGYGSLLIAGLLSALNRDHQVIRLRATVHRDNVPSLATFESQGFVRVGNDGPFELFDLER